MTEILKGKTPAEANALFKSFHAKVTGRDDPLRAAGDSKMMPNGSSR